MLHGSEGARLEPMPGQGHAMRTDLGAKFEHAVQRQDSDGYLGGLTRDSARASVADHLLVAAHRCLRQSTVIVLVVLCQLKRPGAATSSDAGRAASARPGRTAGTRSSRGDDDCRFGMAFGEPIHRRRPVKSPSPVNVATGPSTWPSSGPACEPSSTSVVVNPAVTHCPASASTPTGSLREDRRFWRHAFRPATRRGRRASARAVDQQTHGPAPRSGRGTCKAPGRRRWSSDPVGRDRGRAGAGSSRSVPRPGAGRGGTGAQRQGGQDC